MAKTFLKTETVVTNKAITPESPGYVIQKISNDPTFTDIERYVKPGTLSINWRAKEIRLDYDIIYLKDGEDITKKLSVNYSSIVASNFKKITPRDASGELVIEYTETKVHQKINEMLQYNDDLTPKMIIEKEITKVPMFDYLIKMIQMDISITSLIIGFILENDADGFFNSTSQNTPLTLGFNG